MTILFPLFSQEGLDEIVELHTTIVSDAPKADTTETKPWKYSGTFTLTFSQVSFSNWVAGGEEAISGNASTLLSATYLKGNNKWENTLDLGYGLTRQGKDKIIKNEDKIDFSSQFGRKASKQWFYSGLLGFKTQMDKGYKYPNDSVVVSDFLAPGYFLSSLGMEYRPNEKISVFISPATGRLTIVNVPELSALGAYGVNPGETTRMEMGGFVKILFNDKFFEDKLVVRSKLELFSNYLEKPENIDVNWELSLDLKVGNYITARFQTIMIYDDDAIARLQIKELFGVGFSYRF